MNENKIGQGSDTIRLIKKDEELVSKIIKQQNLATTKTPIVSDMLRYNVWTMAQFCDLTGYKPSTVTNMTRPNYRDGKLVTELDFCYPFQSISSMGPKFIIRNEKSEKMLPKVEQR